MYNWKKIRHTQNTIHTMQPEWHAWLKIFLIEQEKILLSVLSELSVHILQHARAHGRIILGQV